MAGEVGSGGDTGRPFKLIDRTPEFPTGRTRPCRARGRRTVDAREHQGPLLAGGHGTRVGEVIASAEA